MTTDEMRVAFVGVGRMGAAMARCVVDAGFHVTVFDVSDQAARALSDAKPGKVEVAHTPAGAAAAAEIVEVMVNDDEQVLGACLGNDGIIEGAPRDAVLLLHSTIEHETLRAVAAAGRARGLRVLDAPVSGAMGHRSAGALCVMVGGDVDAFSTAEPVLHTYGRLVRHLGPLGAGLDAKLALNLLRYINYLACQEHARFLDATGIDGMTMREIALYAGANALVGDIAKNRVPDDYEDRVHNAEMAQKDLRAAVARADEIGLEVPTTEFAVGRMPGVWAVNDAATRSSRRAR